MSDYPYTVRLVGTDVTAFGGWTYAETFRGLGRLVNGAYGRSEHGRSFELLEHTPSGGILVLMRVDVLPASED